MTNLNFVAQDSKQLTKSGASSGIYFTSDLRNDKWRGALFFVNVSAAQGTSPTLNIQIYSKDPVTGNYTQVPFDAFLEQTGAGQSSYLYYPGVTAGDQNSNRRAPGALTRDYRLRIAIGGTDFAYSTGTLTSSGVNVTAGKVFTVGGKTYTFKNALTEAKAANTLTSDATAPSNNDTVTLNTTVYTFKTALTETRASATLTSNGTQVSDGDTFTIGHGVNRKTYTFRSALSSPAIPNEILLETSAAVTLDNVKLAITQTSGSGTKWSANTEKHPTIDATTNTNTTQLFIARTAGQAGNVFESTETADTLSFGDTVFAGGVDPVANEVLIGASAAIALDNLKLAVNGSARTDQAEEYSTGTIAHPTIDATTNTDTTQLFVAKVVGTAPNAYPTEETSAHLSFADTTLGGAGATVVGVDSIANEVLKGSSAADTLDNVKLAVNATASGLGVKFSTATVANTDATATTNTDTVQTFQAISVIKAVGDAVALSTDETTLTASGASLSGGATDPAFTFSIGGTYIL